MERLDPTAGEPPTANSEAEQEAQTDWEAEGIAAARADVAAGRLVDLGQVRAWAESLNTDQKLPVPYSGRC